jgi:hypothetical protein
VGGSTTAETRTDITTSTSIVPMTQTVNELRNEIRQAVGRHERIESTAFTKEAPAAICTAVNYDIDTNNLPSKPQMRAGILWKIGELHDDNPEQTSNAFRKAELKAIAASLQNNE